MEQKKSVGIWIRVSTEDQVKGESPETHEKRARLYAEAKGWEVETVYHLEALSGKSVMDYAETKRMLSDIRSGNISGIIFSKLARLARNTKELLEFADIFKQENADLISLQEAIDTSSPAGRLFYTMIAAMAQWEREEIASRVIASIPIRAKMGKHIGGRPSLGYKWDGKAWVIDEEYAPVRKLVYDLFLKLKRKKAVARTLNEQGYRTRTGKKFSDTTILHLLRDPTAKGEKRSNFTDNVGGKANGLKPVSEWVLSKCPAIVSEEVWNECNMLLDKMERKMEKPGRQPQFLLAGFVKCEECGKKMYVYHKTKTPTYTCTACKIRIHVEDLDSIYHDQLKTYLLADTSVSEYLQKADSELQQKEKLLLTVLEERKKLKKQIEEMVHMRVSGEWSKEIFAEHYKPLEERILQADNQLPELQAEVDFLKIQYYSGDTVFANARDLYSQWDTYEFEHKRTIVELITQSIVVGKEDVQINLSHLPTNSPKAATPTRTPSNNSNSQNPVKRQNDLTVMFFFIWQLIPPFRTLPRTPKSIG